MGPENFNPRQQFEDAEKQKETAIDAAHEEALGINKQIDEAEQKTRELKGGGEQPAVVEKTEGEEVGVEKSAEAQGAEQPKEGQEANLEAEDKKIKESLEANKEQAKIQAEEWIKKEEDRLEKDRLEKKKNWPVPSGALLAATGGLVGTMVAESVMLMKAGASFETVVKLLNGMKPEFMSPEAFQRINSLDVMATPIMAGAAIAAGLFVAMMAPRIKNFFERRKLKKQKEELFGKQEEKNKEPELSFEKIKKEMGK